MRHAARLARLVAAIAIPVALCAAFAVLVGRPDERPVVRTRVAVSAPSAIPVDRARVAALAALEALRAPIPVPDPGDARAKHRLRCQATSYVLRREGHAGFLALVRLLREGMNGAPMAIVLAETWTPEFDDALYATAVDPAVPDGSRATAFAALGWVDQSTVRDWLLARLAEGRRDERTALIFAIADQRDARAIRVLRSLAAAGDPGTLSSPPGTLVRIDPVEGALLAREFERARESAAPPK